MAGSYVDFVESVIYGTALAPNPNHRDWLALGLTSGTDWLTHYLDRMLPAYEAWTSAEGLPPVTPWDGTRRAPWDSTEDFPPGPDLDGSFTGIATLNALGSALSTRYDNVAAVARELNGKLKAPFSYRFWGYLKWAWTMRERFLGHQVFPTGVVDRDGTIIPRSSSWTHSTTPTGAGTVLERHRCREALPPHDRRSAHAARHSRRRPRRRRLPALPPAFHGLTRRRGWVRTARYIQ
jgi:hypothetical protein